MTQKFSNNARATLAGSISTSAVSFAVSTADADRFPVATTSNWAAPADWFKAVLTDKAGRYEIIYVGTRAAGSATFSLVLRGQEGTTAQAFSPGTFVHLAPTAKDVEDCLAGVYPGLITQSGVTGRVTPVGGIIMWSGAVSAIPAGWQLCNGTNGTPDLRDRFIIGANTDGAGVAQTNVTSALTKTGGTKDAVVVFHDHSISGTANSAGLHSHGVTDPGHRHTMAGNVVSFGSTGNVMVEGSSGAATNFATTGISINNGGEHIHGVSGTALATGSSGTNANLPPYYALAFIQCMASA